MVNLSVCADWEPHRNVIFRSYNNKREWHLWVEWKKKHWKNTHTTLTHTFTSTRSTSHALAFVLYYELRVCKLLHGFNLFSKPSEQANKQSLPICKWILIRMPHLFIVHEMTLRFMMNGTQRNPATAKWTEIAIYRLSHNTHERKIVLR